MLAYGEELLPSGVPAPFASEQEALAAWRKHRERLMSERHPNTCPMGLFRYELESFSSLESIRALRLDRGALDKGRCEFESCADWHRRNGRVELADEFDARAERMRQIIAEMGVTVGETNLST
jgi:hypothetical protein